MRPRDSVIGALAARRTNREILGRPLPRQVLAEVLWAAAGVNRARGPFGLTGRTAATASNSQELELFALMRDGAFRYEPEGHALVRVSNADLRPHAISAGQRELGANAPLRLIFVLDVDRLEHTQGFDEPRLHDPGGQLAYACVDTGLMAGNVYLYAAATGLAAWFHNCEGDRLKRALKLRAGQRALFGQTVGYPRTHQGRGGSNRMAWRYSDRR